MRIAEPSRTALGVALRRAAHQIHDAPLVLDDPLAVRLLGTAYGAELAKTPNKARRPHSGALRAYVVARSRYAEDQLARAVEERGFRQYVVLGAGLDTFAYRNPFSGVKVFEVDHPETQAWKRRLLGDAGIATPPGVTFVPVDFESGTLRETLLAADGFDAGAGTFFAWLGVVPYLTLEGFRGTLKVIAGVGPESAVALDYGLPREALPERDQRERDSLAARVAQAGEPFRLFFTAAEMRMELKAFVEVEDLAPAEINARFFAARSDGLEVRRAAGRFVTAWRGPPGGPG